MCIQCVCFGEGSARHGEDAVQVWPAIGFVQLLDSFEIVLDNLPSGEFAAAVAIVGSRDGQLFQLGVHALASIRNEATPHLDATRGEDECRASETCRIEYESAGRDGLIVGLASRTWPQMILKALMRALH